MTCRYLQSVLQISCPAIDLTAFTAVANAAVDVGSGQTYTALTPEFTVPGSPMNIFLAGFFLEDVAVGMYQDLIPNIVSRDLLIAATGAHTWTVIPNIMSRDLLIAATGAHTLTVIFNIVSRDLLIAATGEHTSTVIPNIVSRDLLIAATGEHILTVMVWSLLGCVL